MLRAACALLLLCGPALAADDDERPPLGDAPQALPAKTLDRHGDPAPEPLPEPKPAPKPNVLLNEGKYQGVVIGGEALPPHPPKAGKSAPQRLTWSGFQMKNGVPTVFLELTGPPDYSIDTKGSAVVVRLKGTGIHLRNNRRPLKLEAFETTVRNVSAKAHGKDVEVRIETRAANQPHSERVEPAAGGYSMLVIELPATK